MAKKDYEHVFFAIATLATRKDICPYSYLGVKNINFGEISLKAPLRMDMAITYRCNNDCTHCYMGGPQERSELDTAQWKSVIDTIDAIDVGSMVFTGGEPTLRSDLVDYNHDLVTGLVTNGRLLTKDLVRKLESAELDHIQITIEGLEKTHNFMVGSADAYTETVKGLKNALDSSIFTLTDTTLTRKNCKEFSPLLEELHSLGLKRFAVNSVIYSGKAENADYGLTASELKPLLEDISDLAAGYGMEMVWYTPTRRCELDSVRDGPWPEMLFSSSHKCHS
ncbi:MAG: radical SAM protein [Candidatus Methanofastidiosia archaeon]